MSIYRKSPRGVWYYYVCANGKRHRGSTGTRDRGAAALFAETLAFSLRRKSPRDRLLKLLDALFPAATPPDIPVGSIAGECERIGRDAGKPPTEHSMKSRGIALKRLSRWLDAARPEVRGARGIDRATAQAFAAHLAREGLCDKSRANILGDLSAMWNVLKREHDGLENPWPLARPLHVEKRRREAFTPDEARRVFAEADRAGHGWGLAARIAAATGLRYGDIARLKFGDIRDGAIITRPHKTAAHGIEVALPLPPDLLARIGGGRPGAFVLPEHAEGYPSKFTLAHPFSEIIRAAGIDPKRGYAFHSFRHYFRTQLARAGVDDATAMRLGGWTQRETAGRYDHDDHRAELGGAIAAAWALTANG